MDDALVLKETLNPQASGLSVLILVLMDDALVQAAIARFGIIIKS